MHRALLIAVAGALAAAAAAPAAGAATIALEHGCYLSAQPGLPNGQAIKVAGQGFTPNAPVTFTLGSRQLGTVTADATGSFVGQFSSPSIGGSTTFKAIRTLTASDGTNQASTKVNLRRLAADFLPSNGNPRTLKVHFYVYGFGPLLTALGKSTNQKVYEHVLDPSGRLRGTFGAGRTSGACGDLKTDKRRVLPFKPKNGRWTFVFTTDRHYHRNSQPRASVGLVVRTIFRPR